MNKCFQTTLFLLIASITASSWAMDNDSKNNSKIEPVKNLASIINKSIMRGNKDIYLPAGTYIAGPKTIEIHDNVCLHGDGNATVIRLAKDTGIALSLGSGSSVSKVFIDGSNGKAGSVGDGIIAFKQNLSNILIDSVSFKDSKRACIVTDNTDDITIQNCRFDNIVLAISIQFSNNVRILNNTVNNATLHGIQFWGNWNWERKDCRNILISGNIVKNGGGGAIWGAGASNVIVTGNSVDGAADVGIDLEWCDDSVISANTVSNFENGGISLFFSCNGVSITGNTIKNNRPIKESINGWWARAGIWLTYPDKKTFLKDDGHRNVSITGNTIICSEGEYRAMWIGSESENITIGNNNISSGEIWQGGGDANPMIKISDNTVINN